MPETKPARPARRKQPESSPAAFVKIYTNFKEMLPSIDANALKVWLFIALSINRESEQAHPGIRTLARDCRLAPNTVTACVKKLETLGLLAVDREKKKFNIYEIPAYVSAHAGGAAGETSGKTSSSVGRSIRKMGKTPPKPGIKKPDLGITGSKEGITVPDMGITPPKPGINGPDLWITGSKEGITVPEMGITEETVAAIDTAVKSVAMNDTETVAMNDTETVAIIDTEEESVASAEKSVAIKSASVATAVRLNQINQIQPDTTTTRRTGAVFKIYESEIGLLTPRIRDTLNETLDVLKLPPEWIIEAIELAAAHNKRNWAYCDAILKRWAVEGKTALPPRHKPSGSRRRTSGDHSEFFKLLERA